ncbi:MAG TPA: hypothetical protein VIC28_04285 [Thermoanaerobaculia bacterium]
MNRLYRSELKKTARPADRFDVPPASAAEGRVRLVKKGTAHIPAVYAKA